MSEAVVDTSFYVRRPGRVAFDLARSWGLILLALAGALAWPHPATWAAAVVVLGTQLYALQILLHDGLHRTLSATKEGTDRLCRLLLCYPLFTALLPFRSKHLEHHRTLGTAEDPDAYYWRASDKGTRLRFLFFCTSLTAAWNGVAGALRLGRKPTVTAHKEPQPGGGLDWLLVLFVQGAIATALTWLGGPLAYPLLWVVPFGLGVFVLQSLRSFAEHAQAGPDAVSWPRLVTYTSSRLERVFFAPNNMNYHAEHHLYPQVPYYHLPRLREHLRASGELGVAELRGSYLAFLWRYWRSLPHVPTPAPTPERVAG